MPSQANVPPVVVLAVLYALVAGNVVIYRWSRRRYPVAADRQAYDVSWLTRAFRYAMPSLYLLVIADLPLALFFWGVEPAGLARLAAAAATGVAALALLAWSLATLGANFSACYDARLPARVVREGPYRVFRHPIYLSNVLLLVATNLGAFNWPLVCLSGALVVFYVVSIVEEERGLRRVESREPNPGP